MRLTFFYLQWILCQLCALLFKCYWVSISSEFVHHVIAKALMYAPKLRRVFYKNHIYVAPWGFDFRAVMYTRQFVQGRGEAWGRNFETEARRRFKTIVILVIIVCVPNYQLPQTHTCIHTNGWLQRQIWGTSFEDEAEMLRQRRNRGSFVEDEAMHKAENSRPRWRQGSKNSALKSLEVRQLPWGLHHCFRGAMITIKWQCVAAVGKELSLLPMKMVAMWTVAKLLGSHAYYGHKCAFCTLHYE